MRPLKTPTFDTEFALNTIQKNADVVIYFIINLCLNRLSKSVLPLNLSIVKNVILNFFGGKY